MSKKVLKKERQKRKDFAERLAEKLHNTGIGHIDVGALSDNSGRWVGLRVKNFLLNFSFDMKGENIDKIAIYKDVWQKVTEEEILSFKKPKSND